jgi:hypothetical protein
VLLCVAVAFLATTDRSTAQALSALRREYGVGEEYRLGFIRVRHLSLSLFVSLSHGLAQAFRTFRYQRVWDPRVERMVTLAPLPADLAADPMDFLGPDLPPHTVPPARSIGVSS